jgi:integrase
LSPGEADRLVGALRTHRDRAMVLAMLLAGLRRCEVLWLRFADVQVADRRLAVVEGKGGHHRVVPAANRFFDALGAYLHDERPGTARTDRVFVVLKGPRRGLPLSAEGLDEILAGARRRAGLEHATCHELRHTCLTRLQGRGVASDATFRTRCEDGALGAADLIPQKPQQIMNEKVQVRQVYEDEDAAGDTMFHRVLLHRKAA